MNPADFELQHSTTPQPKLLDGECATRDWPMPAGGVWVPRPAVEPELTLAQRIAMVFDRVLG